ncbi:NAD(P)H-binding protein [Holophaga foetida]|uniref:NAD(P)H-binding protein n=1 Tax=Holophaga foetida TaxID=35839 RepID=UPI0002473708|nr:NAD(P)H-binding protein [Holophaga foetida]
MKVVLFGSTGMIGQGVLRECLRDENVTQVVAVVRAATGRSLPKVKEVCTPDLFDLSAVESDLQGADACFDCLGVSAAGLGEVDYTRLTYDLTLSIAETLVRLNPGMTFIYVSGAGTDSSERGRSMWARVKGRTENALQRLPFGRVYLFRPGFIQPRHGIRSRTQWYRIFYALSGPFIWLINKFAPGVILSTESLGWAMLTAAQRGASNAVLEARELNRLANVHPLNTQM